MKIISWNINGYRAITGQNKKKRYDKIIQKNTLFEYVERNNPDILCMQETKAHPEQIDDHLLAPEGYKSFFSSCKVKKGYSGVCIYSKRDPDYIERDFGKDIFDDEGRVLHIGLDDLSIFNVYFPNGKKGPERVDYKLKFYDYLFSQADKQLKDGKKVLVCGDYNTAHKAIDLARPEQNKKTSGFLPEERDKIDEIVDLGYHDTFRMFNKEPDNYTWWTPRGRARENNVGWRIDYHFVSDNLKNNVKNAFHQPDELGSDHCPIIVELS